MSRRDQMAESIIDSEYRRAFASEYAVGMLPYQIRSMRIDRGWSQKDLADRIGTTQEGVSRIENPNYTRYTTTTLKKLAEAFDVVYLGRFVTFSELLDMLSDLSKVDMNVESYEVERT